MNEKEIERVTRIHLNANRLAHCLIWFTDEITQVIASYIRVWGAPGDGVLPADSSSIVFCGPVMEGMQHHEQLDVIKHEVAHAITGLSIRMRLRFSIMSRLKKLGLVEQVFGDGHTENWFKVYKRLGGIGPSRWEAKTHHGTFGDLAMPKGFKSHLPWPMFYERAPLVPDLRYLRKARGYSYI